MAKKKEYINWFLDEIPILKDKGIIQDDTSSLFSMPIPIETGRALPFIYYWSTY